MLAVVGTWYWWRSDFCELCKILSHRLKLHVDEQIFTLDLSLESAGDFVM
jgi:hypothetical protein